jgi:hypothetical protein
MTRAWILLACSAVCGCNSSDSGPPDYSPAGGGAANPITCDTLRHEAPPVDGSGHFVVDGGQAGCVQNGLECSLGGCDGGAATAMCMWNAWLLLCVPAHDGGKQDSGAPDGQGVPDVEQADTTEQ